MTTNILDTKIGEVKNKIPDVSGLVTTAALDTKILEVNNNIPVYAKYITNEFNKFADTIFDKRQTQANPVMNKDQYFVSRCEHKNKEKTTYVYLFSWQ